MLGIGWLELFVLILASFRLAHLVVFDTILEPFRRWLSGASQAKPDAWHGGGQGPSPSYGHPAGRQAVGPIRSFLSGLVGCYWCAGIWLSAATLAVYIAWPSPLVEGLLLLLAIAGGQALLESVTRR